ncbi:hypothetical protein BHE74_00036175 [Ensete ventricosum]|nr:hypothetical protein GW17_00008470 [Ensete ventricosum]RWW57061.1 hypothetical protein BHE74_00036175 [Ensete ventricosum]RZS15608.1 hypothetical protein BHM03_00047464 [Ensete ventricosum]
MSDFTVRTDTNLIVGGISPGTHHQGEGLVLQERFREVRRRTRIEVATRAELKHPQQMARRRATNVTRALDACQPWGGCPSRDTANLGRNLSTPACTLFVWRREHTFPHPGSILKLTQQPKANSSLNKPKDPDGDSRGISGACQLGLGHSGNVSSSYPLHPVAHPTTELTASGSPPPPDKSNVATK